MLSFTNTIKEHSKSRSRYVYALENCYTRLVIRSRAPWIKYQATIAVEDSRTCHCSRSLSWCPRYSESLSNVSYRLTDSTPLCNLFKHSMRLSMSARWSKQVSVDMYAKYSTFLRFCNKVGNVLLVNSLLVFLWQWMSHCLVRSLNYVAESDKRNNEQTHW